MKRRSLVVHATSIAVSGTVAFVGAMLTASPVGVMAVGASMVTMTATCLLVINRLESQGKAFARLVSKVAIDQSRDYYAPLVPADVLAAARLPVYVYPDDDEQERQS